MEHKILTNDLIESEIETKPDPRPVYCLLSPRTKWWKIYHSTTLEILTSSVKASTRGYSERLGIPKIWRNTSDSRGRNFHIVLVSLWKKMHNNAYGVHVPSITARHLLRMFVIRFCIRFCGASLHSATSASLSSSKVLVFTCLADIARWRMSHACSIGFRSADRTDQCLMFQMGRG